MLRPRRKPGRIWVRAAIVLAAIVVLVPLAAAGVAAWLLLASRPILEGDQALAGLGAPVEVARDASGVPTLTAASRNDLARGLGFIQAQERFFQMDLLRRAGAGELSGLVGAVALPADRMRRVHRFRTRAAAVLAAMSAPDRALLAAYTDGVNAGLAALGHAPWEYTALRVAAQRWTPADTLLVVYALYFDLQNSDPDTQLDAAAARRKLGPAMAAFLYPQGVPADAALDGSHFPEPPIPADRDPAAAGAGAMEPPPTPGSNNFAVAGQLSATGAAIVENDMHLALRVPNIWFRARLVLPGALDIVGVTLPGVPFVVVGSNTHIAWAFTDSYIESGDAVTIETLPDGRYKTPDGPRQFTTVTETICAAHAACEDLPIRQTIWGPVMRQDPAGRPVVWRWMAHDDNAVGVRGFLGLEHAQDIRHALDAAHAAGLPDQNFVVGDNAGHIAWTIIGQVPRRIGLADQLPHSWADGSHAWRGYLAASEIPEIIDPADGRLWSANARMVGGHAYDLLGNGGYAGPYRAGAIHDDLMAHQRFTERDMLSIATDARNHTLDPWQKLLLKAIDSQTATGNAAPMRQYVTGWGGTAVPDSVGYRLVHDFRGNIIKRIYAGLAAATRPAGDDEIPEGRNPDWPSLRLLAAQPAALVPPPFTSWAALIADAVNATAAGANGDFAQYTWGARNHTGIHDPIAAAIPGLHFLTDPPDIPVAGDTIVPRVAIPGFGASERIVVSPGHEDRAIFDMPAGQAGNPLSPYYGVGEQAWVDGAATPLLPGATRWRLHLVPAGH
jgi:penicillin amidase